MNVGAAGLDDPWDGNSSDGDASDIAFVDLLPPPKLPAEAAAAAIAAVAAATEGGGARARSWSLHGNGAAGGSKRKGKSRGAMIMSKSAMDKVAETAKRDPMLDRYI